MALSSLTGTISHTVLNANFADKTAALTTNAKSGQKDWQVDIDVLLLGSDTALAERCVDFTMPDDAELRVLGLATYGNGANTPTVTMTLTCIDDDEESFTDQLLGKTVSTSLTANSSASTEVTSRADYTSSSGEKHFLEKGLTYRLTLTSTTTNDLARTFGFALLRARRRRT